MVASKKKTESYRHAEHVSWRSVEGDAVILDLNTSDYFSLNETAAVMWERLGRGATVAAMAEAACADYDVTEKDALRDARKLVSDLLKRKLIRPA